MLDSGIPFQGRVAGEILKSMGNNYPVGREILLPSYNVRLRRVSACKRCKRIKFKLEFFSIGNK